MLSWTKILAALAVSATLMAKGALSADGQKYLKEADKRITRISKEIDADKADAAKARAANDDLLASKRFLDNVQKEDPKNAQAAKLQSEADGLLKDLQQTLLSAEIKRQLDEVDGVLAKIETDVKSGKRSAEVERELDTRFDGVRSYVKAVLSKDPTNARALADKQREDDLWKELMAQRAAAAKGGK